MLGIPADRSAGGGYKLRIRINYEAEVVAFPLSPETLASLRSRHQNFSRDNITLRQVTTMTALRPVFPEMKL
jgi:hypothetical protein